MRERPGGSRLAYRYKGAAPGVRASTLVFLPGYMSDMSGSKASALFDWAADQGRGCLLLDYAGCGQSAGDFAQQGLTDWRDDVLFLIDTATQGPVTIVGSSMGGWLMLLVALARPLRTAALIGIAAAPDFTGWGFSQEEKLVILREGRLERPSDYGDAPMVTTSKFFHSGEANRLLHGPIAIDCPVRLLHGQADRDVPWAYSLELANKLRSADVQLYLIKDGDHRLSRDADIALLLDVAARLP
jgi:pimeloyl-ACP methyl ester carboxylesterase